MPTNDLVFNQAATILNDIQKQATGNGDVTILNTNDFVTVAQTVLKTGYEPIMNAVSQVLSQTIFSIRPYDRKFKGLKVDTIRFGNHVRKLSPIDDKFSDDEDIELTDGTAIDMYKINKPKVAQFNYYGQNVYKRVVTRFKKQIQVAFSSPEELVRFWAMITQNVLDCIEQGHENSARMTITNLIGGVLHSGAGTPRVVNLLATYNAETGSTLTIDTVKQPENWKNFVQWAFAYIKTLSGYLTNRTTIYHTNVTDKTITRHTPLRSQKMYILSSYMNDIATRVMANTFNENYLKMIDYEEVDFWQSIKSPNTIHVNASYLDTDGTIKSAEVNQDNVFGVLFDTEAAGYTTIDEEVSTTPYNSAGRYVNTFWHFTDRYYNDFTENAIVFILGNEA